MKRFALFSMLVAAATGLGFVATTGAATRMASSCGCTDCRCPDCNGEFCTCEVCECENCACAERKGTENAVLPTGERAAAAVEACRPGCCAK